MWFMIGWCACGVAAILLSALMQHLRDPSVNILKFNAGEVANICFFGPLFLAIGVYQFFAQMSLYQSKNTYVLRKFES
jgi:hypothetical protein